jgi:YHS domain-containing protein
MLGLSPNAVLLLAVSAAALLTAGTAAAGEAEEEKGLQPQKTCPIMGGKVDRDICVDALGQRIYLCCKGCVDAARKDPAKALKTLGTRGEFAESLQKTCPVMGGKVDPELYVEYEGRRIYVCCGGCIDKVKAEPALYARKVAEQWEKERKKAEAAAHAADEHDGHVQQ